MTDSAGSGPAAQIRPQLETAVSEFNERAKTDPKFQETLRDVERRIQLVVEGDATYHFHLKDNQIDGVRDGPIEGAEVLVTTDKETLLGILSGEVSAMGAYLKKRIKFKATLMDLLILKKLF